MGNDCGKKPSLELLEGIGQFNRGEYYECHETLEDLWREEAGEIREIYKGILQVGVGIYHAKRSNLKGAARLVSSGIELLGPFSPECMGIDVARLIQEAQRFRQELNEPASGRGLGAGTVPVIRFIEDNG